MHVLVTGGRNFADQGLVQSTLKAIHSKTPITLLIHGAASGADQLPGEWAVQIGIEVLACPADWKRFGKGAGPIRNRQMLDHSPELLVAFPGGKGTSDMIKAAQNKRLPIQHS